MGTFALVLLLATVTIFVVKQINSLHQGYSFALDQWKGVNMQILYMLIISGSSFYPNAVSSTSKAYSFIDKKSKGGHLSDYVFCVEGCLRLQKNIVLRPINRRNTASQRFWCKWALIWVFCIGKPLFSTYLLFRAL